VRPRIHWRGPAGRDAPAIIVNERVLDLLADIMFAIDEIREVVEVERPSSYAGFDDALDRMYAEAATAMRRFSKG
jgi:hypothetical protein